MRNPLDRYFLLQLTAPIDGECFCKARHVLVTTRSGRRVLATDCQAFFRRGGAVFFSSLKSLLPQVRSTPLTTARCQSNRKFLSSLKSLKWLWLRWQTKPPQSPAPLTEQQYKKCEVKNVIKRSTYSQLVNDKTIFMGIKISQIIPHSHARPNPETRRGATYTLSGWESLHLILSDECYFSLCDGEILHDTLDGTHYCQNYWI